MSVGNRLLESGHYASQQIQQISGQLEQEWKAFAAALDERSTLLEMSASFHQKADQVATPPQWHREYLTQLRCVRRHSHEPCVVIKVYFSFTKPHQSLYIIILPFYRGLCFSRNTDWKRKMNRKKNRSRGCFFRPSSDHLNHQYCFTSLCLRLQR